MLMYDLPFINFRNFSRPSVSDDLCEDSALRHPRFWRRRFLIYLFFFLFFFFFFFFDGNLSNIDRADSEKKSFEILNIFPVQMYGASTNA